MHSKKQPLEATVAKIEANDTPRSARKVPSSHSVKSKKSSNFLAALVRKTRRKRKPSPGHSLDLIRSDSSFIKGAENEIELRCQNYEKNDSFEEHNMASTSKGSDHSLSSPKRKNNFLKTLLKKQSRENIRKSSDHNLSSVHSGPESDCEKYSDNEKSPIINIPSSYIIFSKPNLSPPLATGLQMVQDINNNLKDSENNLIEMIMKHVSDSKFQRELLNSFSYHSKLQMETERRASALANDMWVQQVEIGKAQERTLQETLNSLVKQNRQLQIDHESIYRKYERLLKKFMSCAETGAKPRASDLESHLDHVIKNSEKLRSKLDVYLRQNENLEGELHLVQNQNVCLEKQLRNCSAQMQTLKNCVNKLKTDHELEKLATNTKLQIKENIIKEIVEAGDTFLEDFSSLKKQFKEMHINFNWSKFKVKKESIPDLINMGKTFINEISKELMSIYTQIIMKNKELEDIRQANSKLQENLQKSSNELQNLSKKFDEVKSSESSRMVALQEKCKTYEKEICDVKEKCDKEKSELIKKITDKEKETVDAECSSTMLEQSKKFISSLSAENFALKSQIDTLNKLLMENGAGDVERKLQNSNEQLEFYHSKYLEFFDENQKLLIQLEAISRENIRFREQYDEDIVKTRKQLREFEDIVQENKKLKQKVDKQHLTLQTLQAERMKYLDEKNMLKSIYQHMKSEVSRCNKLEEVVSIMSKEAGHFALIAEYNKKVGDQLKAEVEEKNSKILELRTSVEKLNELQIQNTKEKLSLCYELSEVCSLQKQTDCILNQEIQKYKELDHKKKELVETASSTIQKYEEKQKNERIALKILLKDVKSLFEEKNTLMMQNSNFVKENEDLKYSLTKVTNENESLQMEIKNISSELQSKTNHLLEHESQIRQLTDKANYELEKSETKIVHFESTLKQLEEEKSGLQESVKYLQNNLQKVQKDLDESRTKEQNLRNNFNKTVEEKNRLEMLVKTETEKMIRDREEMKREIEYLNQVCDNVLKEFEANIISTEEKEEMFKKELDESKSLIIESSMELEKLVKHVSSKDATIQKLTVASQKFTSNLKRIERDYKELERKHRHTMNEFQSLNVVLNSLRQDMGILNANHRAALEHIANLEQEKVLSAKELEDDKLLYKKHVEELARKCEEYEEDTASLQSEIADLRNKLENEKSAYSTLACLHKEISAKFMKIVKDMITIKNAKQEALSRANKLGEELAKIKSEKNLLEDKVLTIQNDVKHYENLYKQCLEKRMTLEKEITASHLQGPEEHEATLANCQKHQKMVESLQKDLKDSYDTIDELKLTVYDYKRQITDLELKRSEMNLKLHETQRRLNTEQALVEQLRNTHKLILAAVLEMKERGRVDSNDGGLLLSMVQSSANTTASDESIQRACLSDPTIEPVTNDK